MLGREQWKGLTWVNSGSFGGQLLRTRRRGRCRRDGSRGRRSSVVCTSRSLRSQRLQADQYARSVAAVRGGHRDILVCERSGRCAADDDGADAREPMLDVVVKRMLRTLGVDFREGWVADQGDVLAMVSQLNGQVGGEANVDVTH